MGGGFYSVCIIYLTSPSVCPSDLLSNIHIFYFNTCRSNDAWLPHESSRYQEKLHKVISSALYDVFGELRGVQFCLDDNPGKCPTSW